MKMGLRNAIAALDKNQQAFLADTTHNAYRVPLEENHAAFLLGLDTLSSINLPAMTNLSLQACGK